MINKTLTLLLFFFLTSQIKAQDVVSHDHNHEGHSHHSHHTNEIAIATSPVYFVNEKELTFAIHFHYLHFIKDSKFGIGLGYEKILDEHNHETIGIVGSYHLNEKMSINLSPGVSFENKRNMNFALHIESAYEFSIQNFHFGPVIEFAYDSEDQHISLGLHIGFGF